VFTTLFILLLKDENISGNLSRDTTGYSLSVIKHYNSNHPRRFLAKVVDEIDKSNPKSIILFGS
jgi:transposase